MKKVYEKPKIVEEDICIEDIIAASNIIENTINKILDWFGGLFPTNPFDGIFPF